MKKKDARFEHFLGKMDLSKAYCSAKREKTVSKNFEDGDMVI